MHFRPLRLFMLGAASLLAACASSPPEGPLSGEKRIILMGNKGEQLDIGSVTFTPVADGATYTIRIDHRHFTDYFLSMKEMKCLEGPELWCHLPYPYQQPRKVTRDDFSWLAHDLLFMYKKKGEFGANFWNGIYYQMHLTDDAITGVAQAVDLNQLAAPPEDFTVPPFGEFERTDIEPEPRFLPFVEIR
ncbi:hypothetical protein [Alteromonas lipolytica]|uniref:Lipoprotein n=1 Tax=Alteromonas lipolytica TaxID=1856405 RepID=A0A1E8FHW2_9ALTE|nr:hypothetical protein [Alteromonas lipolytica]OFI35522.1 hypothetical protein BFC17_12225 [Alteromonas lipolytica]GGF76936.1 hypothetical protein GCM10011338_31480 [Alteromonas lipolytica]